MVWFGGGFAGGIVLPQDDFDDRMIWWQNYFDDRKETNPRLAFYDATVLIARRFLTADSPLGNVPLILIL